MSYDKLKKLGGATGGSYKYENPYSKKEPVRVTRADNEEKQAKGTAMAEQSIFDQNNYLLSQLYELKRQQDDLKYDIVTLLMMLEAKEEGQPEIFKISAQAIREKYFGFRASKKHILNRVIDKTEALIKKDLNFNANSNTEGDL